VPVSVSVPVPGLISPSLPEIADARLVEFPVPSVSVTVPGPIPPVPPPLNCRERAAAPSARRRLRVPGTPLRKRCVLQIATAARVADRPVGRRDAMTSINQTHATHRLPASGRMVGRLKTCLRGP
jgi:hypothetical protein